MRWFQSLIQRRASRKHLTRPRRLRFEELEDRTVPATELVSMSLPVMFGNFSSNLSPETAAISNDGRYVVFQSSATNLVSGDTNDWGDIFVRDQVLGTTTRVSVDSAGNQSNANSYRPTISGDGRFVAFTSDATNLIADDTNGASDVFIRNLQLGTTTRISVDSAGSQANAGSLRPSLSDDGRFVSFESDATNLIGGDSNTRTDVFVRDLQLGTTTRVSVDDLGVEGNSISAVASMSGDGRFVTFTSFATNLVPGDTNNRQDVFVRDLQLGTTTLVSVDSAGVQGNGVSFPTDISSDGRFVVFSSDASNLVAADTNGAADVFLRDRQLGTTTRASVDSAGNQGNAYSYPGSISSNGRYVAFFSLASNLVAGDTNGFDDVFVRDLQTSTTTRVSVGVGFSQGNNSSLHVSINGDGGFVAFTSLADNLVSGDTNTFDDVFVRNITSGTTVAASVRDGSPGSAGGNSTSGYIGTHLTSIRSVSANGRFVVFSSVASNLVVGDSNGASDIFIRDLLLDTTTRVSIDSSGNQANQASFNPTISPDGRFVAFESHASNLVADDSNGREDIYVRDLLLGTTTRASVDSTGIQANAESWFPSLSADGRFVAFQSLASNLVPGDTNNHFDIFIRDLLLETTSRVSVGSNGEQGNAGAWYPSLSSDGRFIAFHSNATNLIPGSSINHGDIFVRDLQQGTTTRVSVDSAGNLANAFSVYPSISADGRFVAFSSIASNLVAGDTNGVSDIFVRDLQLGTTTRVSVNSSGSQANQSSDYPSISGDGRYVAFNSAASNLVNGDTAWTDIFVHNMQSSTTTRISVDGVGDQANGHSARSSISPDGRFVAFQSAATNLALDDFNGSINDVILVALNQPPLAHAGGPYAIFVGGSLTLNASGSSDPDGDPLTYSWDVNGDGVFGDAAGVMPTLTWAQLRALGIDARTTPFSVRVRVSDAKDTVDSAPTTLTVTATTPTYSPPGLQSGNTNVLTNFSLGSFADALASGSWTVAVAWGDGSSESFNAASPGAYSWPHSYGAMGLYTVAVTITNSYGKSASGTFQIVAGTYVINTSDSGPGSLRQAMLYSNASVGIFDTIRFAIGSGVKTITPFSALPTITDSVNLDGTTQPGFTGAPIIELNGASAGGGTNGLTITSSGSTIKGLVVNRFGGNGILCTGSGATGNVIAGNYIGTNVSGAAALANSGAGVLIQSGAKSNRIGTNGDGANDGAEGNVISGNSQSGIQITGSETDSNAIAGNRIGTNASGTAAVRNRFGVNIAQGARFNLVGTDGSNDAFNAYERNVISGNSLNGVDINGAGTDSNVVAGNYIGTNAGGTSSIANLGGGMAVLTRFNLVGTNADGIADDLERNVISGNGFDGIFIGGEGNDFAGNFIGTDWTGTVPVANPRFGIIIQGSSNNHRIGTNADGVLDSQERNIISGNGTGVFINLARASLNVVAGNYIGTDVSGTLDLGNATDGVRIQSGATNNTIGGNSESARNIISGNNGEGVEITGSGTNNNLVAGNYIGTNALGSTAIPNLSHGVFLRQGAQSNRVGSDSNGQGDLFERNIISGNSGVGVLIQNTNTNLNTVAGNFIGLGVDGESPVPNAAGLALDAGPANNLIGGSTPAARNVISGNNSHGIGVYQPGTNANRIQGNYVSTNATGTRSVWNFQGSGINVGLSAANTIIGTDGDGTNDATEGNVVSGSYYANISLFSVGSDNTVIAGNFIGTTFNGSAVIDGHSSFAGIAVGFGARNTRIGTDGNGQSDAFEGNVISGNGDGIIVHTRNFDGTMPPGGRLTELTSIAGNFIGTDRHGQFAIPNRSNGVLVQTGAVHTRIGTDGNGVGDFTERNIISGNSGNGVFIHGVGSNNTRVAGNYIGTNATGTARVPNGVRGVAIHEGPTDTIVGTNGDGVGDASEWNLISGNTLQGVYVSSFIAGIGSDRNVIAGNFIGTNVDGTATLHNGLDGIWMAGASKSNRIGTNADGISDELERNVISGNARTGIVLSGLGTDGNVIAGNLIGTDVSGTTAIPNKQSAGIWVQDRASNNRIGAVAVGARAAVERNVISGNAAQGIVLVGAGTTGNLIAGNYIGTDHTGSQPLPNAGDGILIAGDASGNFVGSTVINKLLIASWRTSQILQVQGGIGTPSILVGAGLGGLSFPLGLTVGPDGVLYATAENHQIYRYDALSGAFLGTWSGGLLEPRKLTFGPDGNLYVVSRQTNAVVRFNAATGASMGNFISNVNGPWGLGFGPDGNLYVVDIEGRIQKYNGTTGAYIGQFSSELVPGGSNPIWTANGDMVVASRLNNRVVRLNGSTGALLATISNNAELLRSPENIAFGPDGSLYVASIFNNTVLRFDVNSNAFLGYAVTAGAGGLSFPHGIAWSTIAAPGNTIAFNGGDGISVIGGSTGNSLRGNSIHSNAGLGIDLGNDGVSFNDAGDADTGPNRLLNFPVITDARYGSTTRIVGTIDSPGNGPFVIDFFANSAADGSGYGEGQRYLGSATVTADGGFDVTVLVATTAGEWITATLTDAAGNTSEISLAVLVNNPPVAHAGGPYARREGDTLVLDASQSSDPDGDPLTYSWDVNGDEVYGDAVGVNPTLSWPQLQALGIDDGPSSFNVRVRVSDDRGHSTDSDAVSLTLSNTAPTAVFSNGGPVGEGSTGLVSFASQFDPSAADTTAGFRYSYDFDNDGVFEIVGSSSASVSVPAMYLADGPGTRTVKGRIEDKDGDVTDSTTTLTILNLVPVVGISGPTDGVPGQPRTLRFSATDPSPVDLAAGFGYLIDWGDGTPLETIGRTAGNGSGVALDHVYTTPGTYIVRVTATDKDTGTSSEVSHVLTIGYVQVQGTTLALGGTLVGDEITIGPGKTAGTINIFIKSGNTRLIDADYAIPAHRILVFGQAGNDIITLVDKKPELTVSAFIYGGDGKDTISAVGSKANNVLSGDAGDDVLIGSQCGRDLLIGGAGEDKLHAETGAGSILIGALTHYDLGHSLITFDLKLAGLVGIMAEWSRTDVDYGTRTSHLLGPAGGGTAGGLNGDAYLNAQSVQEDAVGDSFWGNTSTAAPDWFFAALGGPNVDTIRNYTAGELITRLD